MPKIYLPKAVQKELDKLANGCCEYCKYLQFYSPVRFSNEHIIPLIQNGTNDLENLAKACQACNNSKHTAISALDSITNEVVPLFHPRKDNWNEHFKWSDDLLTMVGLTPTGRATIIRLKTNRQRIQNFRKIAIGGGHPPD